MRAAAGFRVELNAEGRNVCVGDSLAGIVVYVDKAELGKRRQGIAFYCVAVVLACDVYTAGLHILAGMISAAVTVLKLAGFAAAGQG